MRAILGFLLILIFSCSPEKRLSRLVKNNPQLIRSDTIFKHDTTIVNGIQHDTIFRTQITKDTLVIKEKQLTIKYYNDGTTTYLKGVCDTIKVIKEVPILVTSVSPVEYINKLKWWQIALMVIGGISIGFYGLDLYFSSKK